MTISVFGLGYVGIVSAVCFARDGFKVIGVDVNSKKVDNINAGIAPIIETGLTELLSVGLESNRIIATTDFEYAILNSDVSIVSVGTPSQEDGALDLTYVRRVFNDIANVVHTNGKEHTIILRSTVFPGTTKDIGNTIKSNFIGINLHIGFNPEFLREGSAIKDFDEAEQTVIGIDQDDDVVSTIRTLYATVDAPIQVLSTQEAELTKYASNAWHATKISFSNEIGRIANHLDIDSRKVMEVLVSDKKLNSSKAYMKPGFAYGGSCLPKDVRAIDYFAKINNIDLPLVASLAKSNKAQIDLAIKMILAKNPKKVGILGLAFKAGTDDLRESPAVSLAEGLMSKGIEMLILDHAVNESKLIGSNLEFINSKIPHLSDLIVSSPIELIEGSDVIVVTHGAAEFREILNQLENETFILDLSGIIKSNIDQPNYKGIAW